MEEGEEGSGGGHSKHEGSEMEMSLNCSRGQQKAQGMSRASVEDSEDSSGRGVGQGWVIGVFHVL